MKTLEQTPEAMEIVGDAMTVIIPGGGIVAAIAKGASDQGVTSADISTKKCICLQ